MQTATLKHYAIYFLIALCAMPQGCARYNKLKQTVRKVVSAYRDSFFQAQAPSHSVDIVDQFFLGVLLTYGGWRYFEERRKAFYAYASYKQQPQPYSAARHLSPIADYTINWR